MLRYFRENAVTFKDAETMSPEQLQKKIVVGEIIGLQRPTLVEAVTRMMKEAKNYAETE
jgi:hypothetical protein